jgi:hypothetical protein
VVASAFLTSPEVRRWLNGIEPAWTMLEFDSLNALRQAPSTNNHAIRLEPDLADAEISGSAVTANALNLLRRAAETGGLKLTATGNLSRAVVEEMFGIIKAPGYDKTELLRVQKVINEPDVLPLHFVRILTQAAKLLRTYRGKLIPTPLGRRMLATEQHGPLQALLFHVALWHMNLAYFDGYALDSWPLTQVGVILWSLSATAHDWLPRETLTRLCASPVIGVLESQWDFGSSAMEGRILRPLVWFGLLESRTEPRSATELLNAVCTGKRRCLIVSCNSMFRLRTQAFAISRSCPDANVARSKRVGVIYPRVPSTGPLCAASSEVADGQSQPIREEGRVNCDATLLEQLCTR